MTSEDLAYYRARAAQEREAADLAADPQIAAIHAELAKSYEALVEYPQMRTQLRQVG